MLKFNLPAKIVKAANLFKAVGDVRLFLNGICIEKDHVIGTNGHALFFSKLDEPVPVEENLIIRTVGNIPAKAYLMEFEIDIEAKFGRAICKSAFGQVVGIVYIETIDGKFPDWRKVIKQDNQQAVTQIGINCEYLDRLQKAVKLVGHPRSTGAVMNLYGQDRHLHFEIKDPEYRSTVIIMPMRL